MKKGKVLTLAAAALMTVSLAFPTQVYATSRTTTTELTGAQVLGATRTAVIGEDVTASQITDQTAINGLKDMDSVASLVSETPGVDLKADEISILDSMEINLADGVEVSEANPLYLTFSFPGVTANTKAFVLHFVNGAWKVEETTVADGTITGKFTSFSPVAIVVETSTLNSSVLGSDRATSPRTGDSSRVVIMLAVAAALCGGCVAARKKVFA